MGEMEVDKTLDRSDDRLEAPAHSDTPDYSPRAVSTTRGANIVRGGFQTLSIIPQRHGGRVNRAIFIDEPRPRRCATPSPCLPCRFSALEGWQSSPVFHDPKISSRSHGEIEKLTPLFARGIPRRRRRASLLRLILDFLYTTRHGDSAPCLDSDEYSLEEFITSIYARVSNSYPGRSTDTVEPIDVYPSPFPRILAGVNSFERGRKRKRERRETFGRRCSVDTFQFRHVLLITSYSYKRIKSSLLFCEH